MTSQRAHGDDEGGAERRRGALTHHALRPAATRSQARTLALTKSSSRAAGSNSEAHTAMPRTDDVPAGARAAGRAPAPPSDEHEPGGEDEPPVDRAARWGWLGCGGARPSRPGRRPASRSRWLGARSRPGCAGRPGSTASRVHALVGVPGPDVGDARSVSRPGGRQGAAVDGGDREDVLDRGGDEHLVGSAEDVVGQVGLTDDRDGRARTTRGRGRASLRQGSRSTAAG